MGKVTRQITILSYSFLVQRKNSEVAFNPLYRNISNEAMSAVIHGMNTPSCDTTLQQNLPLKKYKYFKGTMLTSTVTYVG
jgi:hypothetical protein